jgi:enoyl-CoA hydratase/carnithine racemase
VSSSAQDSDRASASASASSSTSAALPASAPEIIAERRGDFGFLTLNRPKALNALSLQMVRDLTAALHSWMDDPSVQGVGIRGMGREEPFATFCAGGDIRFLHRAGVDGSDDLAAFFTEEYALNHLIHTYPKPYIAFMDGVVMGGGMGISQGASLRIVTERTRMAMPETAIGLFPDVGGGYFLSRCPGRIGEWLALTGDTIDGAQAITCGLADVSVLAAEQAGLWDLLGSRAFGSAQAIKDWCATEFVASTAGGNCAIAEIDHHFSEAGVQEILNTLEASASEWARTAARTLRKRSPLMLHVVLEQIRRARSMGLADDLRMERDMVHQCFHLRLGASETLEGIRALVIDKDHAPQWNPATVEAVTQEMVNPFFDSPWTPDKHPLRQLA